MRRTIAPYKVLTRSSTLSVRPGVRTTLIFHRGFLGNLEPGKLVSSMRGRHGGSLGSGIVSCVRLASSGSLSLWVAGVLVVRDARSLRLLACRRTLGIYLRALARVPTRYILVVRGRLRVFLRQLGSRVGY